MVRIIGNPSTTTKPTTSSLARQAIKAWPRTAYTPRKVTNHLRREWIKQIQFLGPRWLLHPANAIQRKMSGAADTDAVVFMACVTSFAIFAMWCLL